MLLIVKMIIGQGLVNLRVLCAALATAELMMKCGSIETRGVLPAKITAKLGLQFSVVGTGNFSSLLLREQQTRSQLCPLSEA